MYKLVEKPAYQSRGTMVYLHRNITISKKILIDHSFEGNGNGYPRLLLIDGWEKFGDVAMRTNVLLSLFSVSLLLTVNFTKSKANTLMLRNERVVQ